MAIELEYLPLEKNELPVSKIFTIGNDYVFLFRENKRHSRIYLEIRDLDDNILYTTRLIYGNYLVHAAVEGLDLESEIIPFNIDDLLTDAVIEDQTVEADNLVRVKQYVIA